MWLRRRREQNPRSGGRRTLAIEPLEERTVLDHGPVVLPDGSLEILLDPTLDPFGFQAVTIQAYEERVAFSILDTGASVVTFSAFDQALFALGGAPIPVKVPFGAVAEGIGGELVGDVSEPGTIYADGLHVAGLQFDEDGFPVFDIGFDAASATVPGVQVFLGTESGSSVLPTITGTPILNPSPQHPNGLALHIQPQGHLLDLSDLAPGLIIPIPDVRFQTPGSALAGTAETTAPVRAAVDLIGGDNHLDPGAEITYSPNPVFAQTTLTHGGVTLVDQVHLFDTGAQLSTMSLAQAKALGFDLESPLMTIDVSGAAGTVESIPGFLLDRITLPLDGGRTLSFVNVPIFALDVADAIDGILGMNLFNYASSIVYDPFDPAGASLQWTFFRDPGHDEIVLDPTTEALLQLISPVLLQSVSPGQMPGFAVNRAPTTVTDGLTAREDTTLVLAAPGVLSNDADPEGAPLAAVLVQGPTHGTLTLNADGSLTYRPAPNFHGVDEFQYRASDGRLDSEVTTVSISVDPTGDAPGVFRNGYWFLDLNDNRNWDGLGIDTAFPFGLARDAPVTGDWDGDGLDEVGVYRGGLWSLDVNGNGAWDGTGADAAFPFGLAGDQPVVGAWTGSGANVGVFRNGYWFLDTSGNRAWDTSLDAVFAFGLAGDRAVVGDWNNDGTTDVGVCRGSDWFLDLNGNRQWDSGDAHFVFGLPGDGMIAGDVNRDDRSEVGVFRGGYWFLDADGSLGWTTGVDAAFSFGNPGDRAVAGEWNPALGTSSSPRAPAAESATGATMSLDRSAFDGWRGYPLSAESRGTSGPMANAAAPVNPDTADIRSSASSLSTGEVPAAQEGDNGGARRSAARREQSAARDAIDAFFAGATLDEWF